MKNKCHTQKSLCGFDIMKVTTVINDRAGPLFTDPLVTQHVTNWCTAICEQSQANSQGMPMAVGL